MLTVSQEILTALARNPWFRGLPLAEQQALLALGTVTRLRSGEMVFRQGDGVAGVLGGCFYGLISGTVKTSTLRPDGKEAILVMLEPGNWFGEISLIDGSPRTHDATALSAVALLVITGPDFAALMQRPAFSRGMLALLAARVRALYGLMEDATLRSTTARVASRLAMLAHGDASFSPQTQARVQVSQESLAMMLGLTRQTLSKALKELERAGAVVLGYRCIEISAGDALARAVREG